MTLLVGAKKALTLAEARKKDGRKINLEDLSPVSNPAVLIKNKKIIWLGEKKKLNQALRELKISSKQLIEHKVSGHTMIPGFVDCHTHLVFAGNRQNEFEMRNRGATYQEIADKGGGIRSTVKETQNSTESFLLTEAQKRVQRFLRQGVTSLEVKSGYGLTVKDELKILRVAKRLKGVNIVTSFLGPHAVPKGMSTEDYLNEVIQVILPKVVKEKLADRADMFVEKGYFDLSMAEAYYQAAVKLGLRLTCHAEQMNRLGTVSALKRFSNSLDSMDHLVQINEEDIKQLSQMAFTCVLLPTSDFYLRMKYPPARALLDMGARVALASDFNPGTSPTSDLSFVGALARLEMKMSQHEVLVAMTLNGAYALGLQDRLGTLEVGQQADLAILNDSWEELFYQVGYHPVCEVWRAGHCEYS